MKRPVPGHCEGHAITAQPLQAERKAAASLGEKLSSLPGTALSEGEPTPPAAWAWPGLPTFG